MLQSPRFGNVLVTGYPPAIPIGFLCPQLRVTIYLKISQISVETLDGNREDMIGYIELDLDRRLTRYTWNVAITGHPVPHLQFG